MKNNIKVSIIMPVYKVEDFVSKAIESILHQTLTEFEFLIVDDGTPDRSGEICDNYAKDDSRIHVIHKTNGGAPSARNLAIDMAKGKYIYFMDSDDWAEPHMLEDMYSLAEENQSQLVIAGFYIDTYYAPGKYLTSNYIPEKAVYRTKEEFRANAYKLFDKNMLYPPWNKLFLRKYIVEHGLYFPSTFWDDFPFNLSVIRNIDSITVTSGQYYHFLRARSESETAKYIPAMYEKREEEHSWMQELYQYWNIDDIAAKEMIARRYIDRLIGCFENFNSQYCTLSRNEKNKRLQEMLENKRVKECIALAKPQSLYAKLMYMPIHWNSPFLIKLETSIITFVKKRNLMLFSILKNKR